MISAYKNTSVYPLKFSRQIHNHVSAIFTISHETQLPANLYLTEPLAYRQGCTPGATLSMPFTFRQDACLSRTL